MDSSRTDRAGWLFGLAFIVALILRLIRLDAWPLTDWEALPALQALHLSQGLKPALGPHPAYILLTAPLFFSYGGGTDYLARFLPALAGSALVFVPWLFRRRLAARPAVLLAFFLALDPGLLALSRHAASSILAIAALLAAWAFWERRQPHPAGVCAALALLGGPSIWAGLLILALAWAIGHGLDSRRARQEEQPPSGDFPIDDDWKSGLVSLLFTLIAVGTLFFLAPGGLGAALASLPAYLEGWGRPSGVPADMLVAALLVYHPLVLALAVGALVRAWRADDRTGLRLGLWALVALLLSVFYPARQVTDLGWAVIPLCVLAAIELDRHLDVEPQDRVETIGVALLTLLVLIFAWLDLTTLLWLPFPSAAFSQATVLFIGSLVLLTASLVLVAFGWSVRVAQRGGLWGATVALGLYTLAAAFYAGGLRANRTPELWSPGLYPAEADLLAATVDDLSEWETGYQGSLVVTITGVDSPALAWVLRGYQQRQSAALDVSAAPPIVITSEQADPSLAAVYRGQDFAWLQTPQWEATAFTSPWHWISYRLRWLALRELPQSTDTILLWARDDLFLDAPR
jgi:hypothetical protein